jgi:hypothetical protein
MNIKSEIVLSVFSVGVGVLGTWIGFQKFSNDQRERMLLERKQVILMEKNIEILKLDYEALTKQFSLLFEKLDNRADTLERHQLEMQIMLKQLLTQKGDK